MHAPLTKIKLQPPPPEMRCPSCRAMCDCLGTLSRDWQPPESPPWPCQQILLVCTECGYVARWSGGELAPVPLETSVLRRLMRLPYFALAVGELQKKARVRPWRVRIREPQALASGESGKSSAVSCQLSEPRTESQEESNHQGHEEYSEWCVFESPATLLVGIGLGYCFTQFLGWMFAE